ncbi:MAG: SDR family oxidoreductase [Elusimicrobia bacterium]|nr:SDR family oxidoreductase [Elusimicrobiota bacterium]MDE2425485.1 SDR family oxidoreductase [Elusimicrobiota bacterium]
MGVLVIGGTGLIGGALARAWRRRGAAVEATYHLLPEPGLRGLDMTDEGAVRGLLEELRPDFVALPAANPHVDYCQLHPEETRRVNVAATLMVARACRRARARMVFFSSDYVFDGRKDSYCESDPPRPLNEYGRQKAEAEAGVLAEDAGNLIVRTSGAYGWQRQPKNFVLQLRERLSRGLRMAVASDLLYNPTAADNLAEVVAELREKGAGGVFHVVGAQRLARYEFALLAARAFGLKESLLDAVPSGSFPSVAPRPRSSTLETGKLRCLVSTPLWGASEGLRRMAAAPLPIKGSDSLLQ